MPSSRSLWAPRHRPSHSATRPQCMVDMIDRHGLHDLDAGLALALTSPMWGTAVLELDIARQALVESAAQDRAASASLGRLLDVVVATLLLIALAPLMALTAIALLLQAKGPVLFAHQRIGRGGRTFNVLKFRTMSVDGERILREHLDANEAARAEWEANHKLRQDPRVSVLGRLLRSSSVDELPQLFNVLRGEMSIVGPRPIVFAEVARYGDFFPAYCSIRPGITGVWQVSGRSDVTYQRRVEMDALYARRKSILLDMRLMLATIPAVLTRRGSY